MPCPTHRDTGGRLSTRVGTSTGWGAGIGASSGGFGWLILLLPAGGVVNVSASLERPDETASASDSTAFLP
jgi:hypothetical protein